MSKESNRIQKPLAERVGMCAVYILLALAMLLCLFPFIYVLANSVSDPKYVISRSV